MQADPNTVAKDSQVKNAQPQKNASTQAKHNSVDGNKDINSGQSKGPEVDTDGEGEDGNVAKRSVDNNGKDGFSSDKGGAREGEFSTGAVV